MSTDTEKSGCRECNGINRHQLACSKHFVTDISLLRPVLDSERKDFEREVRTGYDDPVRDFGRMAQAAKPVCQWTDELDYWAASCGEDWCFVDGGPAENRVRFCQGCGKPVEYAAPTSSLGCVECGQSTDAPVHKVEDVRTCVKCCHDPAKYLVNSECRAAVDSRLFKRTICGCRCQTSIQLEEPQRPTNSVPEPPARVWISENEHWYTTPDVDGGATEYAHLAPVQAAVEVCKVVHEYETYVVHRKSDWEALEDAVK